MESITIKFTANGQTLTGGGLYCASNTVRYIIAEFDLGDNWQGFDSVRAVWSNDFKCISTVLDPDGSCTVPHEVLERRGKVSVNLVGSILEDDELTDRLTTYPVLAITVDANAKICGTETAEVTPSQFEQYVAIVIAEVEKVTGMTAVAYALPEGSAPTANYSGGVLTLGIPKGDAGATGNGISSVEFNEDYSLTFYFTDSEPFTTPSIRGAQGARGYGIASVEKIGSAGLVDTYRINFEDPSVPPTTFTVTNGEEGPQGPRGYTGETGNGIESVYLTATHGAVKTYTILYTDGTTTTFDVTDGEVTNAQLTAVVTDLKEDLSQTIKTNGEIITTHTELFDRSKATLGRSLWSNTDEENPSYGYTDYIDVSNADITMGNKEDNNNTIVYYDANKTRIPPNGVIKNFDSSNLPTGTVYIRFNFALSAIDLVSVVKNETLNCISTDIISDYPKHTTLYLGTGCQFTTLKSAVEYANSIASKYNVVDIMIKEGVYNVFDGYDLTAQPANWWGLYVEDYVNLIGIGSADKVVINGALPVDISEYAFDRQNISTLNFWKNNTLKNVTVTAKNIRYCLHNEDGKTEAVDNAKELFENVKFIYYENDTGIITSRVPVGIGASHGRHTTFKNCIFENQSSHGNYPVLLHNNTAIDTYCEWLFESCDFIGGILNSLKLSSAGSGQTEIVNIKGCKLPHGILFTKENVYTGTTCEYKLFGYGNSIQGGYDFDGVTETSEITEMMI